MADYATGYRLTPIGISSKRFSNDGFQAIYPKFNIAVPISNEPRDLLKGMPQLLLK
jgi:hypothetical protein